ncbi:Putative transferase CAF17, mitochondrial [Cytospora mali]|uniref:Iron-sulfur cluster assembly factor IBA57 homolog, mitochondrial n=1 Tax=Cytospora mali TaxID=578113 RepID=A0A194V5U4_CYTMA|nr:Putative transferase CAF17, mitochondrial [Valsa mali var. pyri (nom. inval.)]
MSSFQSNLIARPFVPTDASPNEDRLTYDSPPDWRPASQASSDGSTSHSGRSDGFDRSSSPNYDNSSSRESSPAFEIILNPDLSYRKEAAAQSAGLSPNDNATSQPSLLPSPDVASQDDSDIDDELWNELMGIDDTEMTEPQPGEAAPSSNSGNSGPDDDDDDEDDPMIAMLTESLDKELEERQKAQQLAAEKEAAESARRKALLDEQLRVAAEKAALATRFDHLHAPTSKKRPRASRKVARQPRLTDRLDQVDKGLYYHGLPEEVAAARIARRRALKNKRQSEALATAAATQTSTHNAGQRTTSTAGTSMQGTNELPRVYHQSDNINWGLLMDSMTLTTNLNTKACFQSLGLGPVQAQELYDKLSEYLRTPGNSVNISRKDIATNKAKQTIAQLAHSLLCDQLWGQTYFNQPHAESGYSNVRFDTDSTWIFLEFSKLLYKTVKAEERRKKTQLRYQQKRDAKNAAQHPVTDNFVPVPGPRPIVDYKAFMIMRLISVSGPDSPKFLQGVITQNILAPTGSGGKPFRDEGFYAAFLNATGRVLHDVFVYPDQRSLSGANGNGNGNGESFLIEVDAGDAARLERHIKRYKLRAKFNVRLLDTGEVTVWHGWDGEGRAALDSLTSGVEDFHRFAQLQDPRAPGFGYRMLKAGDREPLVDLPRVADEEVYRVRRYLMGVPEGPAELLREQALPLEGNLDLMGGIDFRKGCYVGQELTIRTKHRGVVRKRILPVMIYDNNEASEIPQKLEYKPDAADAAAIPTDTSIGRLGRKGRSAGKWLRGVGNVGLALCRLETMTDVVLPGETATSPYNPADEFVMAQQPGEDGNGGFSARIKAFVPEWLRQGLDQQSH